LSPTFIPFTPWTTLEGYVELLDVIEDMALVESVAPIQLAIRLLVTAGSPLLELPDIAAAVAAFDPTSLTWPWRHRDPRVDALHGRVTDLVRHMGAAPRSDVFDAISSLARASLGLSSAPPVLENDGRSTRYRAVVLLRRADGAHLKVLLLATTTGYQIRSFGEAARKLGVELVFASDRCDQLDDPWWDHAIPIRFHDETRSMEAIRAAFPDAPPGGVLAVGDRPTILAARAAEIFGLPAKSTRTRSLRSRNKLASRRAFKAAGLATPWFQPVPVDRDAYELSSHIPYPAVIKPLALSGSEG
jgi:hypothetical protein